MKSSEDVKKELPQEPRIGLEDSAFPHTGPGGLGWDSASGHGWPQSGFAVSGHADLDSGNRHFDAADPEISGLHTGGGQLQETGLSPLALLFPAASTDAFFGAPRCQEELPGCFGGFLPAFEPYHLDDADFFTFHDDSGLIQAADVPGNCVFDSGDIAHSLQDKAGFFHSIFSGEVLDGLFAPHAEPGQHDLPDASHDAGLLSYSPTSDSGMPDGWHGRDALPLHLGGNAAEALPGLHPGQAAHFEEIWINLDHGESGTLHIDSRTIASLLERSGPGQTFAAGSHSPDAGSVSIDANVWTHDHAQDLSYADGRLFYCFTDGHSLVYIDADLMVNPRSPRH